MFKTEEVKASRPGIINQHAGQLRVSLASIRRNAEGILRSCRHIRDDDNGAGRMISENALEILMELEVLTGEQIDFKRFTA